MGSDADRTSPDFVVILPLEDAAFTTALRAMVRTGRLKPPTPEAEKVA
jgi:hypothetical protein